MFALFNSPAFLISLVGIAVGAWIKLLGEAWSKRINQSDASKCRDHDERLENYRDRLIAIETSREGMVSDIHEIKQGVKAIHARIDNLISRGQ